MNQELGSLGCSLSLELYDWGNHPTSLERFPLSKTGLHTPVTLTLPECSQDLCLGEGDLSVLVKNVKHNSNAKDHYYPLRERKPQSSELIQEILS